MSHSLDQLQQLRDTPGFQALPLQAAQSGQLWWQQHDLMTETACRLMIWECASYVALLFDTYGDNTIREAQLSWSIFTDQDDELPYCSFCLEINGLPYREHRNELDEKTLEAMSQIDDCRVLNASLRVFEDALSSQIIRLFSQFKAAFDAPITSAQQAHQIIAKHAGDIGPRLEQALLEQQTAAAKRVAHSPGRL